LGHLNQKVWGDFRAGRFSNVLADLNYTLDKFPNHPKALLLLGSVARLIKSPALPIPYFEKAIQLYPQYALTHAQYGAYMTEIGSVEVGIGKLKKAIEIDPNLSLAHTWLAKAYSQKGKPR
jgi:tetratricopeptide (TPR) repeat protein